MRRNDSFGLVQSYSNLRFLDVRKVSVRLRFADLHYNVNITNILLLCNICCISGKMHCDYAEFMFSLFVSINQA